MSKYVIWYTTKSGDNDSEWVSASSESEAESIFRSEHYNIRSIDLISKK